MKTFSNFITESNKTGSRKFLHLDYDNFPMYHKEAIHDFNKHLSSQFEHHNKHLSDDDRENIEVYTSEDEDHGGNQSRPLNKKLISGKPLNRDEEYMHKSMLKAAHPAGKEIHVYSSTSFNPKHLAEKSEDKILHSPAHISASHDTKVVMQHHYINKDNNGTHHVIHIHVKPEDKIIHTSHLSHFPEESETVIPAGSKLKYLKTTEHKYRHHPNDDSFNVDVHHFEIHNK